MDSVQFRYEISGSATLSPAQVLVGVRKAQVVIPQPDSVVDYLARHPDLVEVLPTIITMARREFGDTAGFFLELFEDQDAGDEYLTLYVRQRDYGPQIMHRLEKLWLAYGPLLENKSGWVLVTIDFAGS